MGKMQKFHFRLQPLLNKERIYEDECVGRLRVIQDTFLNEKNKLENLKKSRLVQLALYFGHRPWNWHKIVHLALAIKGLTSTPLFIFQKMPMKS